MARDAAAQSDSTHNPQFRRLRGRRIEFPFCLRFLGFLIDVEGRHVGRVRRLVNGKPRKATYTDAEMARALVRYERARVVGGAAAEDPESWLAARDHQPLPPETRR